MIINIITLINHHGVLATKINSIQFILQDPNPCGWRAFRMREVEQVRG